MGDILRFMQGDDDYTHRLSCNSKEECPFECDCAFVPLWKRVNEAMYKIYDTTTFEDLLNSESHGGQACT